MTRSHIEIVNARTHNLKGVDVRIALGRLTVITGVSGSGKSSLAFDTLFAEGQRRYVESLSTYARQFIEKMARPEVDAVRHVQPAIAIEQKNSVKNARSTVGTATEISDYLRLLYARAGTTHCPDCRVAVSEDSPQTVAAHLLRQHAGAAAYITAALTHGQKPKPAALRAELLRSGFTRLFVPPGGGPANETLRARPFVELDEAAPEILDAALSATPVRILMDRLTLDSDDLDRLTSSLASAFQAGHGTLEVWLDAGGGRLTAHTFYAGFRCNSCGRAFPRPEPNLFSFNSPIGACPACSGFGRIITIDWDKVCLLYTSPSPRDS